MNDLLLPLPTTPVPSEQRRACLLVADVVGSTAIAHRLPLAHYGGLMTELVQLMYLHFAAHGGQVLQHQGDGVVAVWDAHDAGAALHAGLGIHGRAARLRLASLLGETLHLRVGVALGEVLMMPLAGQPSAYGLPVNLASRLADAAASGETLVCPAVQRQLEASPAGLDLEELLLDRPLSGVSADAQTPDTQTLDTRAPNTQAPNTQPESRWGTLHQGWRLSLREPLVLAGFGAMRAYAATRAAPSAWRGRDPHGPGCPTAQQMKVG